MKKNQQISSRDIASGIALVAKASALFANAGRMTATERKRAAKMKRGAPTVMPTIAHVATKFALELPGMPVADMQSNIDYARSLEPLLGAVSAFYETLRDEQLRANTSAWNTATITYGMLKNGARANPNITNEIAPVTKWFRLVSRGSSPAGGTTTSSKASPAASAVTAPVTAPKSGATDAAAVPVGAAS